MESFIEAIRQQRVLSSAEVGQAVEALVDPAGEEASKADFLKAWRERGETADEIAALVQSLLARAIRPSVKASELNGPLMDICGTGGDRLELFNFSTTSMFILAACGIVVAKHGNRGVTSKSGSADVLETLGIPIQNTPEDTAESLKRHGASFMLAPVFHPAFAAIGPVRKRLAAEGIATVFNVLGPILNPIQPPFQSMGLYDLARGEIVAEVLTKLGRTRAWVVHGRVEDSAAGMDKVSIVGSTDVFEASSDGVRAFALNAQSLPGSALSELKGGGPEENARTLVAILDGTERGPKRQMALVNSAVALLVTEMAKGMEEAIAIVSEAVDSGKAVHRLRQMQVK